MPRWQTRSKNRAQDRGQKQRRVVGNTRAERSIYLWRCQLCPVWYLNAETARDERNYFSPTFQKIESSKIDNAEEKVHAGSEKLTVYMCGKKNKFQKSSKSWRRMICVSVTLDVRSIHVFSSDWSVGKKFDFV